MAEIGVTMISTTRSMRIESRSCVSLVVAEAWEATVFARIARRGGEVMEGRYGVQYIQLL